MSTRLRVVIADDEGPARALLADLLHSWDDVELVGQAASGPEAVRLIEATRPDLALLDLQMPELDGLGVVRMVRREALPLVAFVTAHDEYAVHAFELAAIDYLLKPVQPARLRTTLTRAQERLEQADYDPAETGRLHMAAATIDLGAPTGFLRRIPVRRDEDILILPVEQIASVVAHGEVLHVTLASGERHVLNYTLRELEARLDPARFLRLSRSTIANIELIERVSPMPGGTYVVTLRNRQRLNVSRLRGRAIRDQLLRL
jgi:two-component system LytT family response regulator